MEHAVRVPGAVPRGQDGDGRGNVTGGCCQAAKAIVCNVEIFYAAGEADFAAQGLNLLAEGLHDGRQTIAPQMGPVFIEDGRLALAGREQFQDSAHIRSGAAASQFAVAESAGPTFAEKIIAFRIQRAAGIKGLDIVDAVAHRPAALQDQRLVALLREKIRRHQAGGPGADHDRPLRQRLRAGRGNGKRRFPVEFNPLGARETFFFIAQAGFHRVDKPQGVFIAAVQTLAEDSPTPDLGCGHAQTASHVLAQDHFRLLQRETEIGEAQRHVLTVLAKPQAARLWRRGRRSEPFEVACGSAPRSAGKSFRADD